MSKYIRKRYENYEPYTPGEQLNDREYIKLNTNESPFPPGEEVLKAVTKETQEKLRLYPSPNQDELNEALAEKFRDINPGLKKENFFVSNGSDDIINFAFMAFCDEEKPVIYPNISYGFYKVFSQFHGLKGIEIPLKDDFTIDPTGYYESGNAGLIVFANPNAPTGLSMTLDEIENIVQRNTDKVVLVDEAYVDFGGETAIPLLEKYKNVIISRTFSKSASLAGARLGFAIGDEDLISDLEIIKYSTNPYNVNRMTELAGLAVLRENDYYINNINKIIETRKKTKVGLEELGFNVIESKANFLFVGMGSNEITGEELYLRLKEKGILVRWFNKDIIKDYLRITIGTDENMEELIKCLKELLK